MDRMSDPDTQNGHREAAEPCACNDPALHSRRRFLARASYALGGLTAVLAGVPVIGVFFSPVRRESREVWRAVGEMDDFRIGETVMVGYVDPEPLPWAGMSARSGAWVRREGETDFTAFSIYCTHTACPVTWSQGAELFMCPCHGGTFYPDGRVAGGPPPRPLDRLAVRVRGGRVELRTMGVPRTG